MNALSLTYMVLTRALIASLYRIPRLASILPLPNGIFGRSMRACPPEWKWLFATLQRYNVKHKHNPGKRVANGIACSKEGGNATSPLHSRGSPNKGGQNQKSKPPLGVTSLRTTHATTSTHATTKNGEDNAQFFFGTDQDELAWPALYTVLEMTSRNQGSELSSATMIPHWLW